MNYAEYIDKECIGNISLCPGNRWSEFSMFRHLIELLGEDKLTQWIDSYYEESDNVEDFVCSLHKSLRQTDVFENGHLDMLLYNLMIISVVPEEVFEELYLDIEYIRKKKKPTTVVSEV